ncbi:fimbrial biogenesis chaperone [Volucribacter amazonae]|uniref:Chaperone protein HifB n=1 Tax=Volucribacter amazonae TaxID=256731 RepID=A0A9X4PBY7_9PAST|nr:fimbria/pilus periplasmic chaperone [Volucribacter amazonae]MDG6894736.1 molecular chaperone [Volucribacter amazonae]
MYKGVLLIFCAIWASLSQANIVVTGTRIIYPAEQKNITVQLTNVDKSPSLVQAWIDNGDPQAAPDQIKTPFVITPPITRVDGNKGQSLRITYTGEPLPQDRESVFYFNILDIPPKPSANSGVDNYLQIAIRSRLKLFYRPQNLPISVDEAYKQVQWHIERQGNKTFLVANNQTPYFITYSELAVEQNGGRKVSVKEADMLAPFSQQKFELAGNVSQGTVAWTVINDYGARPKGTSPLR